MRRGATNRWRTGGKKQTPRTLTENQECSEKSSACLKIQADYEETVKDAAEKRAVGLPQHFENGFWFVTEILFWVSTTI